MITYLLGKQSDVETPRQGVPVNAVILGSFGLVDQGEMDWKVLLLESGLAEKVGVLGLADLERVAKGYLGFLMNFFKNSKFMEGKAKNFVDFDEKVFGGEETREIVRHYHGEYLGLLRDEEYADIRRKYHIVTE